MKSVFLKAPEVCTYTSLSRATLYRYMEAGTFPKTVRLGPGRVAWRREDVERWCRTSLDPVVQVPKPVDPSVRQTDRYCVYFRMWCFNNAAWYKIGRTCSRSRRLLEQNHCMPVPGRDLAALSVRDAATAKLLEHEILSFVKTLTGSHDVKRETFLLNGEQVKQVLAYFEMKQ